MVSFPGRSLGVHFSKVRSLTLDSWEPELIKVILKLQRLHLPVAYCEKVPEKIMIAQWIMQPFSLYKQKQNKKN